MYLGGGFGVCRDNRRQLSRLRDEAPLPDLRRSRFPPSLPQECRSLPAWGPRLATLTLRRVPVGLHTSPRRRLRLSARAGDAPRPPSTPPGHRRPRGLLPAADPLPPSPPAHAPRREPGFAPALWQSRRRWRGGLAVPGGTLGNVSLPSTMRKGSGGFHPLAAPSPALPTSPDPAKTSARLLEPILPGLREGDGGVPVSPPGSAVLGRVGELSPAPPLCAGGVRLRLLGAAKGMLPTRRFLLLTREMLR